MQILIFIFLVSITALTGGIAYGFQEPEKSPRYQEYKGLTSLILSPKRLPADIQLPRPETTNQTLLLQEPAIASASQDGHRMDICHDTLPYHTTPLAQQYGHNARAASAYGAKDIENIHIQPRFSGLKGPVISLMRQDIENLFTHNTGSSAEILHNARVENTTNTACKSQFKLEFDIEYRGQHDLTDSDKSPLYRIDGVGRARAHIGQNFMGAMGIKIRGFNNLGKDIDSIDTDLSKAIGSDEILYAYRDFNLDHLTVNGYFTPKPDTYIGAQAGYLEERFLGFGGELLYRPHDRPWAVGFDLWATVKRSPLADLGLNYYKGHHQISGFINGWYDFQDTPITIGASFGRFLAGDVGAELKGIYKPKAGWRLEGYTRISNEAEQTWDNDDTNITAGLRLSAPLGQIRSHPANSRMVVSLEPFGRDKRQRVHNQYPLYDLTDPWSTQNLYRYWNKIAE